MIHLSLVSSTSEPRELSTLLSVSSISVSVLAQGFALCFLNRTESYHMGKK